MAGERQQDRDEHAVVDRRHQPAHRDVAQELGDGRGVLSANVKVRCESQPDTMAMEIAAILATKGCTPRKTVSSFRMMASTLERYEAANEKGQPMPKRVLGARHQVAPASAHAAGSDCDQSKGARSPRRAGRQMRAIKSRVRHQRLILHAAAIDDGVEGRKLGVRVARMAHDEVPLARRRKRLLQLLGIGLGARRSVRSPRNCHWFAARARAELANPMASAATVSAFAAVVRRARIARSRSDGSRISGGRTR